MSLVDDEGVDSWAFAQAAQGAVEKFGQQQSLRSQIKELVVAPQQGRRAPRHFDGFQARIDETRGDVIVPQQTHLILHQGNQGRDDQGDAGLQ